MKTALPTAVLFAALAIPIQVAAEIVTLSPGDDLAMAFAGVAPGDEIVFSAGTYDLDAGLAVTLEGTSTDPISLRGEGSVVLEALNGDFTLHLTGEFFSLSDVEIHGPGTALILEASGAEVLDNVFTGAARGVQCIDCTTVNISGTEFFGLTDADGAAIQGDAFLRGFVEDNWIHDVAGDAIVLEGQTAGNVIADNVCEGLGGDGIRVALPAELMNEPTNEVVRNAVLAAPGLAIATSGAAVVAANLVTDPGVTGIHSTVGQLPDSVEARVLNNTVVGTSECFRATDWSLSSATNVLANNALYCDQGIAIIFEDGGGVGTTVSKNVYVGSVDLPGDSVLGGSLTNDFASAGSGDYYPSSQGPLIGAGAPEWDGAGTDFNGTMYTMPIDVGAYAYTAADNPGIPPGGAFKGGEATSATPDAGSTGGGSDGGVSGGAISGAATGFPERSNGCSCGIAAPGASALPLLFFFAIGRRRRRRRDA